MPDSLRHPDINLRDTIALKLLVMVGGSSQAAGQLQLAREFVDDLAEYIKGLP